MYDTFDKKGLCKISSTISNDDCKKDLFLCKNSFF